MQFRNLGGTIGLAQLSAVLETRIRTHIRDLISSGQISADDSSQIFASLSALSGGANHGGLDNLPANLRHVVTDAYKLGTSDAFLSLVPWCCVGLGLCWFLKNIHEPPSQGQEQEQEQIPSSTEPVVYETDVAQPETREDERDNVRGHVSTPILVSS